MKPTKSKFNTCANSWTYFSLGIWKKNRLIFVKEFWNILEFISWKNSENNNISNAVGNDKWDNETLIQEYEQPKDQAYENIFF